MATPVKLLSTEVFHKRLFPKINSFTYKTYYLSLPLEKLKGLYSNFLFGMNRMGLFSFYDKDHGLRDGSCLIDWLKNQYKSQGLELKGNTFLVAMPRILGYVFNPISFWLTFDTNKKLTSVLCEVNNTYGENHNYICMVSSGGISADKSFVLDKLFHVSPFLERNGHYEFNFAVNDNNLNIYIKHFDVNGDLKLITSLKSITCKLNYLNGMKHYCLIPWMTAKVTLLIYYQAIKLILKGIKFNNKPEQLNTKTSAKKI